MKKAERKRWLSTPSRYYDTGGGWGNAINVQRWPSNEGEAARVVGWKSTMPREGDVLRCPMQSGKTVVGRFSKIERCRDPQDMFFADVEIIGYLGDVDLPAEEGAPRTSWLL